MHEYWLVEYDLGIGRFHTEGPFATHDELVRCMADRAYFNLKSLSLEALDQMRACKIEVPMGTEREAVIQEARGRGMDDPSASGTAL